MRSLADHIGERLPLYLLLIVLGSFLFYYAFVQIPENRNRMDDYGSRILESKAHAIVDKYRGYHQAVSSAPVAYLAYWYFRVKKGTEEFYALDESKSKGEIQFSSSSFDEKETKISKKTFENHARVYDQLQPEIHGPGTTSELKTIWKVKGGASYFIFSPGFTFIDRSKNNQKETVFPYQWTSIQGFTSNLKENDFFDDIFLVRSNPLCCSNPCQECKGQALSDSTILDFEIAGFDDYILDQSRLGLTRFSLPDSARSRSTGIFEATIAGKTYKVYYRLVKLRRGLDIFLVGLASKDAFHSQSKKVSVGFLVLCSLGALILIFLFPVLKLFLLDDHEKLSTADISLGVFSVMLCTCLSCILCFGSYLFWGVKMEGNDSDILALCQDIKKKTKAEINVLYKVLHDTTMVAEDTIYSDRVAKAIHPYDYNEVFLLDSTGRMKKIIAKKGKVPALRTFPVSVAERNYFKAVQSNPQVDYYLESINSFASGNSEVAISAPVTRNGKESIGVITSSLQSLVKASLPTPYKFIVLEHSGDIKFHSGWEQIKTENFLKECDQNSVLATSLTHGIPGYIDFTYLREDSRGYLLPLHKDWSLLVYYKKSVIRDFAAQIFTMSLVSLLLLVVYTMVLHFVLRSGARKHELLKCTSFFYDWMNPNAVDFTTWKTLTLGNLAILIVECVGVALLPSFLSSFLFVLLIITIAYLLNYKVLSDRPSSSLVIKIFYGLIGLTTILFIFLSGWTGLILSIVALGLVTSMFRRLKRKEQDFAPHYLPQVKNSFSAYRLFVLIWLLIIVVGPSVGFLIRHFQHENRISHYAYLIEDIQHQRKKVASSPLSRFYHYHLDSAKQAPLCLATREPKADSLYYAQFPKITSFNKEIACLQFTTTPRIENIFLTSYGDTLQARTQHSSGNTPIDPIVRQSILKGLLISFSRPWVVTLLLMVILAGLLWWVISSLTKKIFYIPRHQAWNILPPTRAPWGSLQFEFEHADNPIHLLHGATSALNPGTQQLQAAAHSPNDQTWEDEKLIHALTKEQQGLYRARWKDLTPQQQFFLYDLAEDGVVNQSNPDLLESLSTKGLIRLYPQLEMVNVSFAQFIRTEIKEAEIMDHEEIKNKVGRWNQIRILLIVTIVAVLAFLSIAEENFFGRATAIIGSITLLVPNLLTLLGSLAKLFTRSPVPTPSTP